MEYALSLFQGRIGRWYYFLGVLTTSALLLLLWIISNYLSAYIGITAYLLIIPPIWIRTSIIVRRFHDLNKSGWWALLLLMPLVNFFVALYILFVKGSISSNKFGEKANTTNFWKVLFNMKRDQVDLVTKHFVKYCEMCGHELSIKSKFCRNCGKRIKISNQNVL